MAENKRKSVWKVLDILVCIAFLLLNGIMLLTSYCGIYLVLCPLALFLTLLCHAPYAKKCAKWLRIAFRTFCYAAAVFFTILPYTMRYDAAWYYPVQRAVVLCCYTYEHRQEFMDDFMPERIPSGAESYQYRFAPKILQGSSLLEISYFTDSEVIAEYRETAEEYGAKHLSLTLPEGMTEENFDLDGDPAEHSNDERLILNWRYFLREDYGQDPDGMELYLFLSGELGHTYGIYVLSEETGYFLLYR